MITPKILFEMIMMRLKDKATLQEIGDEFGVSESRCSQLFSGEIKDMLDNIREEYGTSSGYDVS